MWMVELTALAIGYFLVTVACLRLYFLPTFVAFSRHATHRYLAMALNLFLGWTFICWAIALALSLSGATHSSRIVD